jgi:hypothetical protein
VPQSDGFFTLAKVGGEVTCFFLPRTLPDGSYNRFFVQRLKDKAGNKSNASSEVEYAGTLAIRVTEHMVREAVEDEFLARPMTEAVARLLQGVELLRHSPAEVADVFLATRHCGTAGSWGSHYGTMAFKVDQSAAERIVDRAVIPI